LQNNTIVNSLNISEGDAVLNLNNYNLTVSSYITLVGTMTASGIEQISVGGNWDNTSGWFNAAQSTVNFNGASGYQYVTSGGTSAGKQFNHFAFSGTGSTLTLSGFDLYVSSNMIFSSGSNSFNNLIGNRSITVLNNLTMANKVVSGGNAVWTVGGNFDTQNLLSYSFDQATYTLTGLNKTWMSKNGMTYYGIDIQGNYTFQVPGGSNVGGLYTTVSGTMSITTGDWYEVDYRGGGISVRSTGRITGNGELDINDVPLGFRQQDGVVDISKGLASRY
jgi:hypothetical protein